MLENVNIYYFDREGKYMVMSSMAEAVPRIDITIRYYLRFDTSTSEVGNYNDVPLIHGRRKKQDKFKWYSLTLTRTSDTGSLKDWTVEGLEDPGHIPPEYYPVIDRELRNRLQYWHSKHCNIQYLRTHPKMYHLGHVCYWTNPVIRDISNVTAHVYGNAVVLPHTLSNVFLIVHGKLDFVEDDKDGKYETAVSLFKPEGQDIRV